MRWLDEHPAGLDPALDVEAEQPARHRHLALGELVLGVRRQARVAHRSDPGVASSTSASAGGLGLLPSRTARVRRPRRPFMASNGDGVGALEDGELPQPGSSSALPATTPEGGVVVAGDALVAECRTRSTPWSSGRWISGVAKVESTTVIGPGDGTELLEVHEVEPRVGRRLGDHQHRLARPHRLGERARLGGVHEGDVDAEPGTDGLQQQLVPA
jgi:hypothetical protein